MVKESEVPLGTAEPVLFAGASVVPKGTQCLDYPIFPALKRWAILSEQTEPLPFKSLEQRFYLVPTALFIVSLGQRPRIWIALWLQGEGAIHFRREAASGEPVDCRSTSSGPEQKPKGNALSALVNNPIKNPGAFPQAELRPRR
jgi:hypothetical protein